MQYSLGFQSKIGGRQNNEDRVAVIEREDAVLMVLGDGLGGHKGGEIASQALIESICSSFEHTSAEQLNNPNSFLLFAIGLAHKMIHRKALESNLQEVDPKTTCVVCIIKNGYAHWAHVGDSRLYIVRNNEFIFQTEDHTTDDFDNNSRINRCVGGIQTPRPTIGKKFKLKQEDAIFICSDGAWQNLDPEDIAQHIDYKGPQEGLQALLRKLEKRNAYPSDNLTAAILFWGVQEEDNQQVELSQETRNELNMALSETFSQEQPVTKNRSKKKKKGSSKKIDDVISEIEDFISTLDDKI